MKKIISLVKKIRIGVFGAFVILFIGSCQRASNDINISDESIKNIDYSGAFISVWKTSGEKKEIIIPLNSDYDYSYNLFYSKKDNPKIKGEALNINSRNDYHLQLPELGEYEVKIVGDFPAINFKKENLDKKSLIEIKQWGKIKWKDMTYAFHECSELEITAKDKPDLSNVKSLKGMFFGATKFNQPIGNWDVSKVTDMEQMFMKAKTFNQDLSNWDVSSVTNMKEMFREAKNFNNPLENWDVGNVVDMSHMFYFAINFNEALNSWGEKVEKVTNMEGMFENAETFNQPIESWNVKSVTNMKSMFKEAKNFNQPVGRWNVSNVTNMSYMFRGCGVFDQDLNDWPVNEAIKNPANRINMFDVDFNCPKNTGRWSSKFDDDYDDNTPDRNLGK